MEYKMPRESSTGLGMSDWWTGGQGLNEALRPLSAPLDLSMGIGEESNKEYGIQMPNALSMMQETPAGRSNPHFS